MTPQRRTSDRFTMQTVILSIIGTLVIAAAVALKFLAGASDTLVIALAVIGGVMIPGTHLVGALKAWKGNS